MDPAGRRADLSLVSTSGGLEASYRVLKSGLHRVVFVNDRGIWSRTTRGVKRGGRSANPTALRATRLLSTGIALAGGGPAWKQPPPLGLEFELTAERTRSGLRLQALRSAKPAADVEVRVASKSKPEERPVGITDESGRVHFLSELSEDWLFIADFSEHAGRSDDFDQANFSTSLYLSF